MVRPAHFGSNPETASSNSFQAGQGEPVDPVVAIAEFDNLAELLRVAGVEVLVFEDDAARVSPDAVFPNNWISTFEDGTVLLFPMLSPNRRTERRDDIVQSLASRFLVTRVVDLTAFETQGQYLEGTGSLVLDHVSRVAYACLSPRTDRELVDQFAMAFELRPCVFAAAVDGVPVYHTNVVMSVGEEFAVVGLATVSDVSDRMCLTESLESSGHELIELTTEQIRSFAGNMLQLRNQDGERLIVLSQRALDSLRDDQVSVLKRHGKVLAVPLDCVERHSGGSARCMLAEVFLNRPAS